jgi:hypothetical protein
VWQVNAQYNKHGGNSLEQQAQLTNAQGPRMLGKGQGHKAPTPVGGGGDNPDLESALGKNSVIFQRE